MGLFNLLTNTITGAAELTLNTAKLVVAPVIDLANDDDKATDSAWRGIDRGFDKIGDSGDDDDWF